MELWDAYDRDFNLIERKTLARGEAIPDGLYHLVSDVIVRHVDGEYLLMRRDARKHYGGLWEATAGGAALRGETAHDCAVRELFEETGIAARTLEEVGRVVSDENHTLYVEFLGVTDCDKAAVTLQPGETDAFRWVDEDTLNDMKAGELVTQRMQGFIDGLR